MLYLSHPNGVLSGNIPLVRSKSISNRLLLIRALSGSDFPIHHLSKARDTQDLFRCLEKGGEHWQAGEGGTTYRFLTAFLAFQEGTQELHAEGRMKERPVGALVEALRQLGARIDYLGQAGCPPLRLHPPKYKGRPGLLEIEAGKSSQFISALLMLGPTLDSGLELLLKKPIVSPSYIRMTLALMHQMGIEFSWEDTHIRIAPQPYKAREMSVESDWSAASYYFSMAALARKADIHLEGLQPNSVQGDSILAPLMGAFSVRSEYTDIGLRLSQEANRSRPSFRFDFLETPDLAQTLAVLCAAKGTNAQFCGLETLRIKETDRILALQKELKKVAVDFLPLKEESENEWFEISGKAVIEKPHFETYADHRMAMAFAPFALLGPIGIENPEVVGKSYPGFWEDLQRLGFRLKESDE
jgi:3-phosphoshikimate 1-carboxyvinyltransferase